jgi:hypothetical protein
MPKSGQSRQNFFIQIFMKLKQNNLPLKAFIFGFGILMLLSTGCSKELEFKTNKSIGSETLNVEDKAVALAEAKKYYEERLKVPPPTSRNPGRKDIKALQPLWEHAKVTSLSVEVPYLTDGEVISPSLNNKEDGKKGKGVLVIFNTKQGKAGRIWEYRPSEKFTNSVDALTSVNFMKKKFDGVITVWNLAGSSLGAYVLGNGEFKNKMKVSVKSEQSLNVRDDCYCVVTTYDCHCGRVLGGPRQCSTCYGEYCLSYWGGLCGDNDMIEECQVAGDCSTDCETPNPDCDPCSASPELCDDNGGDDGESGSPGHGGAGGCECANAFVSAAGPPVVFFSYHNTGTALVSIDGEFDVHNCATPLYTFHTILEIEKNDQGTFELEKNNYQVGSATPIDPTDLNCGHSVTQKVYGLVTWKTYDYDYYPNVPLNLQKSYNDLISADLK